MGVAGVAGAALVVAGVVAFASSQSDPSEGAAARSEQWGVDLPDQDAFDGSQAPGIACLPAGCGLWTVETPVEDRPLVGDELVVVVGEEGVAAYEVSTGDRRWRAPTPTGAEELGPNHVALSQHGLALLPAAPDDPSNGPNSVVSGSLELYDAADGSHRGDLDLELDEARTVGWYGDRLVVTGTRAGQPTVVGVTADGHVAWEHEGRRTTLRPAGDDVLLETDGTDVVGVDPATGEQRWRTRGEPPFPDGHPMDTLLVLDPEAGQAQLVDIEQGTVEQTFPTGEATLARRMGPWVATGTAELIRIHDAETGEELLRHEIPVPEGGDDFGETMPLTQVSWQQVDDLMVVTWPPAPGQQDAEVVVYRRDGQQVRIIDVEVHAWPDLRIEAVNSHDATVFVSAVGTAQSQSGEQTIFAIDVHEGRAQEVGQGIDRVGQHDEIVTIRNDNGVRAVGPAGEIDIINGRRLAASRPLMAYGPEGLMRLDPGLLGISE